MSNIKHKNDIIPEILVSVKNPTEDNNKDTTSKFTNRRLLFLSKILNRQVKCRPAQDIYTRELKIYITKS